MPTPTVGQTITAKKNAQILKGNALVVAGGYVIATQTSTDGSQVAVNPIVVPVADVLTAV